MGKKTVLLMAFLVIAAGAVSAQVHFWWWGRAQLTPFERTTEEDDDGNMSAYIWWIRFGVNAANGERTVGFDGEVATMMTDTSADSSRPLGYWADWPDFWSYSMWYKPMPSLFIRVGKWNYVPTNEWILDLFDRTRYATVGIGEDEFFAGYDNMVQYSTGVVAGGSGLSPGALFETYFGPLQFDINFKSVDPEMEPLDYLQTLQVGARYEIPGLGFFRAQMIGFDPDGEIDGNFYKVDNATSQIQAAANVTALPGLEFRIGFHYYLSKSKTNFVDALDSTFNFEADKGAMSIPLGFEVTLFNPLSFRVLGDIQLGDDPEYGKSLTMFKAGGQVKYQLTPNLSALINVMGTNMGKTVVQDALNGDYYAWRKPRVDVGAGIQIGRLKGAAVQTGLFLQIPTADDTQMGIAVPFTFDFGW